MKYYINKPVSHKLDNAIIEGIKKTDPDAIFVEKLCEADVCVLQKGWTRSRICVADYHLAREMRIERREAYIYTDKYTVKLNNKR